ncbi:uncharacterized protein LOC144886225 [Branchiostoma floridae x Branchiostoma japonicum]
MNCTTPGCPGRRRLRRSKLCIDCYDEKVNTDQGHQNEEGGRNEATGGKGHQHAAGNGQQNNGAYSSTSQMLPHDADDISSTAVYESDTGSISDASTSSAIFVPSTSQPTQPQPKSLKSTTAPPSPPQPQDLSSHQSQTPVREPPLQPAGIGPLVSHQTTEEHDDTQSALPIETGPLVTPTSARTAGEGTEANPTQEEERRHARDQSNSSTPPTPSPPTKATMPNRPPETPTATPNPPTETPIPNTPSERKKCLSPMCNQIGDAEHHYFCPVCYALLLQLKWTNCTRASLPTTPILPHQPSSTLQHTGTPSISQHTPSRKSAQHRSSPECTRTLCLTKE